MNHLGTCKLRYLSFLLHILVFEVVQPVQAKSPVVAKSVLLLGSC